MLLPPLSAHEAMLAPACIFRPAHAHDLCFAQVFTLLLLLAWPSAPPPRLKLPRPAPVPLHCPHSRRPLPHLSLTAPSTRPPSLPPHPGSIMKLNTFCPWKEHLYELEVEMGIQGAVLYCLYEVRHALVRHPLRCFFATDGETKGLQCCCHCCFPRRVCASGSSIECPSPPWNQCRRMIARRSGAYRPWVRLPAALRAARRCPRRGEA